MASTYPGTLDTFPINHADDVGEIIHADTINFVADAINKAELELGTNPKGGYTDVKTKLNGINLGNSNTADVVPSGADTYLTGSSLAIAGKIQAATIFRWRFTATKTAAGVATPIFSVRVGTAGTTADTARLTLTGAAQTAATDTAWIELEANIRTYSATGVLQGSLKFVHVNAATGFANTSTQILQNTSGTFDITAASLIIGVSCNPGASGVWTFQNISASAHNLKA